jgi:5-methylcytosine-specific restriction enzyme subunit McrC
MSANAGLRILARAEPGLYDIEASQWVGTIVGSSFRAFIRPKLTIQRLFYLLTFSSDVPRLLPDSALGEAKDLLSLMQTLYAHELSRALQGGALRRYESRSDALAHVRGKINATDLILRRHGMFPPLLCTFDEYTTDNEANRRLYAAAARMRGFPGPPAFIRDLRQSLQHFEGVSLISYGRRLDSVRIDRTMSRYGLALADIILRNASLELQDGRIISAGFLLNMDNVYEQFVVEGLRRALGLSASEWRYHPGHLSLDHEDTVRVIPDVIWQDAGRPWLVLDAKYKLGDLRAADAFQMHSYCTALGVDRGIIIHSGAEDTKFKIKNSNVEIRVIRLDPDGDPGQLTARLAEAATRIRAFIDA